MAESATHRHMCVDLGCGTPVLVFLKNVGGKVVQYSGILPNTEVVCPYWPQCPSAPHYKFRKKEIHIPFCLRGSIWPKKTSQGAWAVGAPGARSPFSGQEGHGGRTCAGRIDQPHRWLVTSSRGCTSSDTSRSYCAAKDLWGVPPPDSLILKAGPYYPRDPLHSTSGENPFACASGLPCATASGIHAPDTRIRGLCNGDRSNARSRPAQQHANGAQRYRQHAALQRPGRR